MSLSSSQLQAAVKSTLAHLEGVARTREELLQVLAHLTAAALVGKEPAFVVGYLTKITGMLDGDFDR